MPLPSRLPSRQRSAKEPTKPFDPKAFLANPGAARTLRHYRPKQAIFSQGERADTVFCIQDGTVRLSVVSTHGKEAIIALLGAGDFDADPPWEGRQVGGSDPRHKSADPGGDDWYNALTCERFPQQIQKAWLHRVQRWVESA
jgi:hypothetical protein